jgi:hypothetical protein
VLARQATQQEAQTAVFSGSVPFNVLRSELVRAVVDGDGDVEVDLAGANLGDPKAWSLVGLVQDWLAISGRKLRVVWGR